MAIETAILSEHPAVVYHRVSGKIRENEAADGAVAAMFAIAHILSADLRLDLILDMRGYVFDNLNAHRVWSIDFKEQRVLQENTRRVAIVGDDSPKLRAEIEAMESDALKFFTGLEAAKRWLQHA